MPTPAEASAPMTVSDKAQSFAADDPALALLQMEYQYVTESSFHSDDLRDKFIQYYLILVGVAFTAMLGLAQLPNVKIHPAVFSLIAFFLFVIGVGLVWIFVRIRRVVWECLVASALIKEYYKKHSSHPDDLKNALLWDQTTVPDSEAWYSASSLLVLVVVFLNSAMLGASLFLLMGATQLQTGSFPASAFVLGIAVLVLSCVVQQWLYFKRLNFEKAQVKRNTRMDEKLAHFGGDLGSTGSTTSTANGP